ncbi:hypothetical protein BGZ60DRAFT_508663 [Tricladium varicosporioides]|nr:hypothetical protein BGZ60DRAFT_508663 [Hymenoscyphus varicosporioides]
MAPLLTTINTISNSSTTSGELKTQWIQPTDVFTVLLLLGGDIVGKALAQLAGGRFTPVTFSFGWVAYTVSAIVSAVGENKLMPTNPDCPCKIINGRSGYVVENMSWILGRIVRDFDSWSNSATKKKRHEILETRWAELKSKDPLAKRPAKAGLIVTVYSPKIKISAGIPERDIIYWSGVFTMFLQLTVATIPFTLSGDWSILGITVAGTILALTTGSLPRWKEEKWACRTHSNDVYALTKGNGSQNVIVILANGHGLNIEDLAMGQRDMDSTVQSTTRASILGLSIFWVLLLITATGVKLNTWFLLAVGGIGILQNIFVAGAPRRPENFGIHLEYVEVFGCPKAMQTLLEVEEKYPSLGRALLSEFFPGKLRCDEIETWEGLSEKAKQV